MQHMFNAGADMVIVRGKENLGLVFKPPKRQRMDDFGLVAEVFPAHVRGLGQGAFVINIIAQLISVHQFMIP